MGAKTGKKPNGKKKGTVEDEDDFSRYFKFSTSVSASSCKSIAGVCCLLILTGDVVFLLFSDEDDFYDRTKKKPSTQKGSESQTVETVDSLLEKRDKVLKEIEEKNEQLSAEKNKMETETVPEATSGDSLDAYMTGLSSTLGNSKVPFYPFIQEHFVNDTNKPFILVSAR